MSRALLHTLLRAPCVALTAVLPVSSASAQVATQGATPVATQVHADTLTSSFTVDGINVILRRNASNNVVVANLYLLGGTRQVTAANAGIEPFLLAVSEHGTRRYPKDVLRRKMSLLGSDIVIAPSVDWTLVSLRATTEVFDSTWAIFADRVMAPALQPADVELVRSQLVSGVRQRGDDPDALVEELADSVAFAGHPYGMPVDGTVASLRTISAADLRAYHESQFVKSRMLLVVVGNVTRAHLESLVRGSLGSLKQGAYRWTLPPAAPQLPAGVVFVQRPLPTNYILGYFAGPLASSPDYQAVRIAMTVLTGEMFSEIRARENLTYDVHAPFLERAASAGGLYVTTVSPDTTLKLMKLFVRELQEELLTPQGLKRLELAFVTDYFLKNETDASQADVLARAQLYQGDYHRALTLIDELRSVSPYAVRQAARTYIANLRFAYVGDSTRVDRRNLEGF